MSFEKFEKPSSEHQSGEEMTPGDEIDAIQDVKARVKALKMRTFQQIHSGRFDEARTTIDRIPDEGTEGDNGEKIRDRLLSLLSMEKMRQEERRIRRESEEQKVTVEPVGTDAPSPERTTNTFQSGGKENVSSLEDDHGKGLDVALGAELERHVSASKDFRDLFDALKTVDAVVLHDGRKMYQLDVMESINDVMGKFYEAADKSTFDINDFFRRGHLRDIPRDFGIADKVGQLMKEEADHFTERKDDEEKLLGEIVQDAGTFSELADVLERLGDIRFSDGEYYSTKPMVDLLRHIQSSYSYKAPEFKEEWFRMITDDGADFTRAGGIRQKVYDLAGSLF